MKRRRYLTVSAATLGALTALIASACADRAATPGGSSSDGRVGQATSALLTGSACVYGQQCQSAQALATILHGGSGDILDTGLNDNGTTANASGTSGTIPVGDSAAPDPTARQELMNFVLTPITSLNGAGYTVVESQLSLHFCPTTANQTINVHQALAPWSETTVSWVSYGEQFVATPFASFNAGALSSFPGCVGAGHSPNGTRIDMTAMVQGWLNGTLAPDGILLEETPVPDVETVVLSSRYPSSGLTPELFVEFNVLCAAGTADCNDNGTDGCETSIDTAQNCGACGSACGAGYGCTNGACAPLCAAGHTLCNGVCEALSTDPNNCGACGDVCPALQNAAPGCSGGACVIASCDAGFGDCDGNAANGCEAPLDTDSNCGACGVACMFNEAGASCSTGVCTFGTCDAGYGDCDHNAGNGCEAPLDTDANCGACGVACAPANAAGTCATGACAIASCDAGFADCDKLVADGCETSTSTDPNNCGACGNVCPTPANGAPTCAGGACEISCNAGFTACGGICDSTSTDPNNCGACGHVCGAGETCQSGSCQSTCPGFPAGNWTLLTSSVAAGLNTSLVKQYLYIDPSNNHWYLSPQTTLTWNWGYYQALNGTYTYCNGSGIGTFGCSSAEGGNFGIGCSNGPGGTCKCLPIYSDNPSGGQVEICQDCPNAFGGGVCEYPIDVYYTYIN